MRYNFSLKDISMTDNKTSSTDSKESGKNKEKRAKGAFPRLALSKVLELPEMIYELGEGTPVRRLTVFDRLGKSSESSTSRELIIASGGGYGLTTGGYTADFLNVTERAREIVASPDQR